MSSQRLLPFRGKLSLKATDEGTIKKDKTMRKQNNRELVGLARNLRNNMTKEERHLWYDFLKTLPQTFNRQEIIGNYIVDFYCSEKKIVIELDGSQHYEDKGAKADRERDSVLSSLGLTVLRYSNLDVNSNFAGVCEDILLHLK